VSVKVDLETLATVPEDPPEAGADLALDPPPPNPGAAGTVLVATTCPADAERDVTRPTETPITAINSAVARIHDLLLFDSNRRSPGRRACGEADRALDVARGGGGMAPAPLDADGSGRGSSGLVGSWSFMMAVLSRR
jgi:hypothetical protein